MSTNANANPSGLTDAQEREIGIAVAALIEAGIERFGSADAFQTALESYNAGNRA